MTVVLLDTSVFCNVLRVPGRDQEADSVMEKLTRLIRENATLLLPLAVVLETGNHVARVGRRDVAERFAQAVRAALEGGAPWIPTPLVTGDELRKWLDAFPDEAARGVSLVDLSIIREWERQCALNRGRRVAIWSLDQHLQGYDRAPEL